MKQQNIWSVNMTCIGKEQKQSILMKNSNGEVEGRRKKKTRKQKVWWGGGGEGGGEGGGALSKAVGRTGRSWMGV